MKAKKIRFKFLKEYREKLEILKQKLKNNDEAYSILGDEFTSVNREYEQLMWDITSKAFKQSYRIGSIAGNRRYLQDATLNWAVVDPPAAQILLTLSNNEKIINERRLYYKRPRKTTLYYSLLRKVSRL